MGSFVEASYNQPRGNPYAGHRGTVQAIIEESDDVDIYEGDLVQVLLEETNETVEFKTYNLHAVATVHGGARWRVDRFIDFILAVNASPKSVRLVGNEAFKVIAEKLSRISTRSLFDCSKLKSLKVLGCTPDWFVDLRDCPVLEKLTLVTNKSTGAPQFNIPHPMPRLSYTFKFDGPMERLKYLHLDGVGIPENTFREGAFPALLDLRLINLFDARHPRHNDRNFFQQGQTDGTAGRRAQEALSNCGRLETLSIDDKSKEHMCVRLSSPTLRALVLHGKGYWMCCRDQDVPKLELWDATCHIEYGAVGSQIRRGQCGIELQCQRCSGTKQYDRLNGNTYTGNSEQLLDEWINERR